jgi:signal-transduction protein with cAMP-binding, CBS, and nucleotidyltransferase domain
MVFHRIGAILVKQGKRLVGIWTERDLAHCILEPGFNIQNTKIRSCMTKKLISAPHDTPVAKLEDMFTGLHIRHLLIEKKGEYIGLLSVRDIIRTSLLEKDRKIKELNAIASWEYYEDWGWDKRRS